MHKHKSKNTHKKHARTPARNKEYFPLTSAPKRSVISSLGIQPELDVTLSFQVGKTALNAAGSVAMVRYRPNALYDVDPVLGSTVVPNFVELSALYTYNRVIHIRYDLYVANLETFPLNVYTIFLNSDPGTLGHMQLQGNRLTRASMIAGKGGIDVKRLVGSSTVANIVGTDIEREDNFRGTSGAVPVDNVWLGIGAYSPVGTFLPNGVMITGRIYMKCRFFDPIANVS